MIDQELILPELPEVETVRLGLKPIILNKKIIQFTQFRKDLRWPIPAGLKKKLEGAEIQDLDRRGKYLIFKLSTGYSILLHLGMSGRLLLSNISNQKADNNRRELGVFYHTVSPPGPHDHIIINFDDGTCVTYNDARRFGALDYAPSRNLSRHKWLHKLGPEPLGNAFSAKFLAGAMKRKSCPIKNALLDQRVVSGLGNIYVCEVLWHCRINPTKKCSDIGETQVLDLVTSIRQILKEAIEAGGSSLRDFKNIKGDLGYFQNQFNVYSKEDAICGRSQCSGLIQRFKQAGRSTFFCSRCQL